MITFDQIEWRDSEIDDVVAVLNTINPKGYSADDIKRHAYNSFAADGKPTFVGTAGWYVTIVHKGYESDKPYIALVSLMAYSVKRYMEEEQARIAALHQRIERLESEVAA